MELDPSLVPSFSPTARLAVLSVTSAILSFVETGLAPPNGFDFPAELLPLLLVAYGSAMQ